MNFYRQSNGKWKIGDYENVPSGMCVELKDPIGKRTIQGLNGVVYASAVPPTSFLNSEGDPYSDEVAYEEATKDFFVSIQKFQVVEQSGVPVFPNGKVIQLQKRIIRPNDVVQYSDNDAFNSSVASPVDIVFENMASANGRGGWLTQIEATSNITALDGKTIRVYFYSQVPTGLVGDNLQMISEDTNTQKGRHYIDIKFNPLVTNDTVVTGQKEAFWNYVCAAADNKLYGRIKLINGFTPIANGWIHLTVTAIQQ